MYQEQAQLSLALKCTPLRKQWVVAGLWLAQGIGVVEAVHQLRHHEGQLLHLDL